VTKINFLMDAPSLSEEVELVEIGQGGHTTAEHQNPSPLYVFIFYEQERKLVNSLYLVLTYHHIPASPKNKAGSD
jgi:hypothetical protein